MFNQLSYDVCQLMIYVFGCSSPGYYFRLSLVDEITYELVPTYFSREQSKLNYIEPH